LGATRIAPLLAAIGVAVSSPTASRDVRVKSDCVSPSAPRRPMSFG
jgi:hypothetical protein